jgi:hypothetical protein
LSSAEIEAILSGLQVGAAQIFFDDEPSDDEIEDFENGTGCDVVTKEWEEQCPLDDSELDELSEDEFDELASDLGIPEDELAALCDFEAEEDDKEEAPPINRGGIFAGGLDTAQRNRERARASAIVAATPRTAEAAPIRPPSTGDAVFWITANSTRFGVRIFQPAAGPFNGGRAAAMLVCNPPAPRLAKDAQAKCLCPLPSSPASSRRCLRSSRSSARRSTSTMRLG